MVDDHGAEFSSPEMEAFLGRVLGLALEHGHAVQMVGSISDDAAPYSYTVGRTMQHEPELVVSCWDHRAGHVILNHVAYALEPGEPMPSLIPAGVAGLNVDVRLRGPIVVGHGPGEVCLAVAERLYASDHPVEAWQVLWPDEAGHYPDELEWSGSQTAYKLVEP